MAIATIETVAAQVAALTAKVDALTTLVARMVQAKPAPPVAKFNSPRNSQLLGAL